MTDKPTHENPTLFNSETLEMAYFTDITLRDIFAGMAMQGLVNGLIGDIRRACQTSGTVEGMAGMFAATLAGEEKQGIPSFEDMAMEKMPAFAVVAYAVADSMLAARSQSDE